MLANHWLISFLRESCNQRVKGLYFVSLCYFHVWSTRSQSWFHLMWLDVNLHQSFSIISSSLAQDQISLQLTNTQSSGSRALNDKKQDAPTWIRLPTVSLDSLTCIIPKSYRLTKASLCIVRRGKPVSVRRPPGRHGPHSKDKI